MFTTVGSRGGRKRPLSTTGGLPLVGTGATVTTNSPLLDLSQTWNNAGVAFTALKLNVTDTLSASGSILFDLQMSGVSVLQYLKSTAAGGSGLKIIAETPDSQNIVITPRNGTTGDCSITGGSVRFERGVAFGQEDNTVVPGAPVGLYTQSTVNLALRSFTATTPVGLRVYNTTDGNPSPTNYERGVIDWTTSPNTLTIGVQSGGTGSGRNLNFVTPTGAGNMVFSPQGTEMLQLRQNLVLISNGSGGTPVWFNNSALFWAPTNAYVLDIGINRTTGSVLQINNGSSGVLTGAYINWGGEARTTANFTSSTSTLTAITGLSSVVLQAGHSYSFRAWLAITGSSVAGVQIGITCSSTTITTLLSDGYMHDAGVMRGSSVGVISSTGTAVTSVSSSTVTSSNPSIRVNGIIRVASSGTFGLTVAQSTANATQTIVSSGSHLLVYDMP